MFDISQAYMGEMVGTDQPVPGAEATETEITREPQTAEEILQHAREEAAEILEQAHEEARRIESEKHAELDAMAEREITMRINRAYSEMGEDLFSARKGIATIVGDAIELMMGAIGSEKAFDLCVDKAIRSYINANNLKVHAHPDCASRLRLLNISKLHDDKNPRYEIIDDPNMEPDRCLLDTGEKRIEVSLDLQIEAIKKSVSTKLYTKVA